MIESNTEYLKTLPEKYFSVPKDEITDANILRIQLHRIDVMIGLLLDAENEDTDDVLDIAYILEGMIYQAQEMSIRLEGIK